MATGLYMGRGIEHLNTIDSPLAIKDRSFKLLVLSILLEGNMEASPDRRAGVFSPRRPSAEM